MKGTWSLYLSLAFALLLLCDKSIAQQQKEIVEKGLQQVSKGIAQNMFRSMRSEGLLVTGGSKRNLYVLPIRDASGTATSLSISLTNKVVGQLRRKLTHYGYVVDSFEHLSDPEVIKAIRSTQLTSNNLSTEAALNEQMMKLHEVDYLFKAVYTESSNKVVIENARLLNNYTKSGQRQSIGADDAESLVDRRFGFGPVWRSMLLPGLGQFQKGQNTKGALVLSGSLLMGAGVAVTESMRGISLKKAQQANNNIVYQAEITNAQSWQVARNVIIAVGGALYLYNVIDAIASKKGRKTLSDYNLAMSPTGDGAVFGYKRRF